MGKAMKGVEIFRTGVWGGDPYTEVHFDGMASAFSNLPIRVPLKLGHAEAQKWFGQNDGAPALGWVDKVYRNPDSDRLLADFTDIPDMVHAMIETKQFRNVSAEVFFNYPGEKGEVWPRALRAVALLGADLPAVSNLKDLQAALMSDHREYKVYDRSGVEVKVYGGEADDLKKKEGDAMDAAEIKKYADQIASLTAQIAELTAKVVAMESRATKAEGDLATRDETYAIKQFTDVTLPGLVKEGKVLPKETEMLIGVFSTMGSALKKYGDKEVSPRAEFVKSLEGRSKSVDFKERAQGGDGKKDTDTPGVATLLRKYTLSGLTHSAALVKIKNEHPEEWEQYIHPGKEDK